MGRGDSRSRPEGEAASRTARPRRRGHVDGPRARERRRCPRDCRRRSSRRGRARRRTTRARTSQLRRRRPRTSAAPKGRPQLRARPRRSGSLARARCRAHGSRTHPKGRAPGHPVPRRCPAHATRGRDRAGARGGAASPPRSGSAVRAPTRRRRSSEEPRTRSSTLTRLMANTEIVEGSWGIDPVPPRLRILTGLETGLLWGNLGVSLLVIVAGAVLVPALSLPAAIVAIVLGCLIGNAMLAVAGMIGADARVPGMALMRAPLGQRGSLLPTSINVFQGIGWTIFELLVIATAAAALSDELFGFEARWLWTIVFGAVALVLALLGPIGFVRRFIRRFAVWAVPLALVYLTWWALDGADLSAIWNAEGEGGLSVWQGADVVVGITVSWIPYAADYTRFSTSRRGALAGTGIGYVIPDAWLLALGAVLVLSRDLGDPAALPAAVVAGGFAAILALFALLVTETDEAFANAYSAAVSLQNAFPRVRQELLILIVTAVATIGALVVDFTSYQSFLLLLGSVFVPLFAVLLADWLAAGAHYTAEDVFEASPWRPGSIAAWFVGFAVYQWLYPTGPSWWTTAVDRLHPPDWGIGATVPSFLVSFGISSVLAYLGRRVTTGAAPA